MEYIYCVCYGLNTYVFPPNSNVETLIPNMKLLGGGTLERQLDFQGGAFMNGIRALTNRIPNDFLALFSPSEDNKLFATQRRVHTRTPSWYPAPELGEINIYYL